MGQGGKVCFALVVAFKTYHKTYWKDSYLNNILILGDCVGEWLFCLQNADFCLQDTSAVCSYGKMAA